MDRNRESSLGNAVSLPTHANVQMRRCSLFFLLSSPCLPVLLVLVIYNTCSIRQGCLESPGSDPLVDFSNWAKRNRWGKMYGSKELPKIYPVEALQIFNPKTSRGHMYDDVRRSSLYSQKIHVRHVQPTS